MNHRQNLCSFWRNPRFATRPSARIHRLLLGLSIVSVLTSTPTVSAQTNREVTTSHPTQGGQPRKDTQSASDRITLTVQDSTIGYVLRTIADRSRRQILFDEKYTAFSKRVRLRIVNATPLQAVETALQKTGLVAKLAPDGETIMVRPEAGNRSRGDSVKAGTITGTIIDSATRKGIPGATVVLQNHAISAVTTTNGAFVLPNVPSGDQVIILKLLGYRQTTRRLTVTEGPNSIGQILLAPSATVLSGVVTTATGQQRRSEVGNAITSLNVDSIMRVAPVATLTDLLETRVPGLTVQRTSGAPGDPARLRLRGTASINGNNDPIVIVDGIRMYAAQSDARNTNQAPTRPKPEKPVYAAPSPLDQIDPNSIETIDVFKGPSAAALYGSDAANGVIVITTRRGRAGPPQWSVALNQGMSYLPDKYPERLYRFGTLNLIGISILCDVDNLLCSQDSLVPYQALNDPRQTILDRGWSSGVTASVSGGQQQLQYALTGSMNTDGDYLKLSDAMLDRYVTSIGRQPPGWMRKPGQYRTWSGQGKVDAQITPNWFVALTSSLFNSTQQRSSLGLQGLQYLVSSYTRPTTVVFEPGYNQFFEQTTSQSLNTMHTIQTNWRARSWLPLTMTFGVQNLARTDKSMIPRDVSRVAASGLGAEDSSGWFGTARSVTTNRSASINTSIPAFRERVTTVVGMTYTQESMSDLRASIDRLPLGGAIPVSGLLATQYTGGRTSFGWLVEPRLNVQSRFFVVPGFRLDNNGLSGSSARLMGLPKMNVSWLVSDEAFFPQTGTVSLLRLRAGYGSAGVQPGPTQRLRLFAIDTGAGIPNFYQGGAAVSDLGNTKLRPERGTEWEGGFEVGFWRNRISLDATWYRKMRYDAIEAIPVAPSVTVGNGNPRKMYANIGVIRNIGGDASLSAQLIERSAVSWHVMMSMYHNTNMVQQLRTGQQPITVTQDGPPEETSTFAVTRIAQGYPLFAWWARPIASYGDANQNGVIEPNEVLLGDTVVYLGPQEPGRTMNLSTNLTFFGGRLSVNAAAAYTGQFAQYNASARALSYSPFVVGQNDPNASLAQQAAAVALTPYARIHMTTVWRFQSFAMNYMVDPAIARFFRANRMQVALQGSNLGLKTNYSGIDPNVNSYSTGNATIDSGAQPQPRTWSLRVTLGN